MYGLPGIALTGYAMESDIRACAEAGFVQHIAKPVDLARLEQAIEVAAQVRCVPSAPPQSSPLRNGLSAVHGTDTVAGD
jgi:DNA-binding NarL/FixJ family response regulator